MIDLKFAFRQLAKNPGFTAVAVVVLALGIGANATIFSIINSVLLKPLRVPHPEELAGVYQHDQDNPDSFRLFSYLDFVDLRSSQNSPFIGLFAFRHATVGLQGELTEKIPVQFVSGNYFTTLGVSPAMGRGFLPEEESSGAPVAVLTDSFWRKLGADPGIINRKIKLTRETVTVVGVMPAGFTGAQILAPEMFLPLGLAPAMTAGPGQSVSKMLTDRGEHGFMLMARFRPGIRPANAGPAIAALNREFPIADPAEQRARTLICRPPSRFNFSPQPARAVDGLGSLAGFASGLSLLVLLVACLNLGNMMLARGAARRTEMAIRLALGSGRRRLLRQLLTEGVLLAAMGAGAGLLLSVWMTKLVTALIYSGGGMPPDFPKFNLAPDWRVLLALLLLSGVATLVFALGPAWNLARSDLNSDLKSPAGTSGRGRRGHVRAREFLAVGQMALALALLAVAVLFRRSAVNVAGANPGFEFGSNFYLSIDPALSGYAAPQVRQLMQDALDRLRALPGVESVSCATSIPFGNSWDVGGVQMGGAPAPTSDAASFAAGKELYAIQNVVGADYFRTLGLPLLRGREFDRREIGDQHEPKVAVISRSMAEQLWPGEDPIGRSIQLPGSSPTVMTVVGVAPEVSWQVFRKRKHAQLYIPFPGDFAGVFNLQVRVAPGFSAAPVMTATRQALTRLAAGIPITEMQTLAGLHYSSPTVRVTRLGSALFGAFGGLALLLSLLGIYATKAYSVARRTRELGVRMALGADRSEVVSMVLRESSWLVVAGLTSGFGLALLIARVARGFLYQVHPFDLLTFILVPFLMLATAFVACFVPARRAASVNPIEALRYE